MSEDPKDEPTRIRLRNTPPDWAVGMEFRAAHVVVRTAANRGPVIELETFAAVAGIKELCALSWPFGGCMLQMDGRFQSAEECPPETPLPAMIPMLEEFVRTTSQTISEILARQARLKAAQDAVDNGANPLEHEGTDWSDI